MNSLSQIPTDQSVDVVSFKTQNDFSQGQLSKAANRKLAALFRSLGDEGRLRLCQSCFKGPRTVNELSEETGMSQSLTSHNLKQLREAGVLVSNRKGRNIFYSLRSELIEKLLEETADFSSGI